MVLMASLVMLEAREPCTTSFNAQEVIGPILPQRRRSPVSWKDYRALDWSATCSVEQVG